MKYLGRQPGDIDVLSIGTTTSPFCLEDKRRVGQVFPPTARRGFLPSGPGLIELLMQASASATHRQAAIVLRPENAEGSGMIRIDTVEKKGRFPLDDPRRLPDLIALGEHAGREHYPAVHERFLGSTVRPFDPRRLDKVQSDGMPPE